MSGISNRLDDWPVQNTKRIRKKPQRFVAEEEEGKESKKKKQSMYILLECLTECNVCLLLSLVF